jgi:hypothetical protein
VPKNFTFTPKCEEGNQKLNIPWEVKLYSIGFSLKTMTFLKRKHTMVEASRFCEDKVAHIKVIEMIKAHFPSLGGKVGVIKLDPRAYSWKGRELFLSYTIMLKRKILKCSKPNSNITENDELNFSFPKLKLRCSNI